MSLRSRIACVPTQIPDMMDTDNLIVALITYFEAHPDAPVDDPQTENGWGQWAESHAEAVLDRIMAAVEKGQAS